MRGLSLLLLCSAVPAFATMLAEAPHIPTFNESVLKELRKRNFIRDTNCTVLANTFLQNEGLPLLGFDGPLTGTREDLDRSHQADVPPEFVDGTRRSEHPFVDFRIKAYGNSRQRDYWYINAVRGRESSTHAKIDFESLFVFRIGASNNHPSCDLIQIIYKDPSGSLSGTYDANRCLSLFDPEVTPIDEGTDGRALIEADCALGLRYFLAMKYPR